ncbi:MAG: hypothetical protein WBA84_06705 [Carnobacterium sp.]
MSENDKAWIKYLNNRLKSLDESYQEEREYLKGEIEKIKKANKECNPG